MTVFLCDRAGVVRAMSTTAESLLSHGDVLRLRHGVLHGWNAGERRHQLYIDFPTRYDIP